MRLLIVDDDASVRESLADALERPGLEVRAALDGANALHLLEEYPADLILTDVRMPKIDGVELLRRVRSQDPTVAVILMTAYDDMATVVEAMREGARDFLVKPLDLRELRKVLERCMAECSQRHGPSSPTGPREASDNPKEYGLDGLKGRAPRMIQVFKIVGQAATSRVNVLIRGEGGTGKELTARAIHLSSALASEPFVPVNCTALSATLLESELFGHVKGAFTGAWADRTGRFQMAGNGTLFLDEVGDTSPELQAKLLRVLQEQEFYPVGGDRPEPTHARIIASTQRNLQALMKENRFLPDLYFRLRVLEIWIPPLRERKEDIPELAEHLLGKVSRALGRPCPSLSQEALGKLKAHSWPGNVLELENTLTRAVVLATGDVIQSRNLDLSGAMSTEDPPLRALEEMEAEHVLRVLEATGWHKSRAAEILGTSRPRLNRLIAKHKLQ